MMESKIKIILEEIVKCQKQPQEQRIKQQIRTKRDTRETRIFLRMEDLIVV